MAQPLIKIPGGSWVDPDRITAVEAHDKDPYFERSRPRVIVRYSPDNCDLGYFATFAEACEARDEIASLTNLAREAASPKARENASTDATEVVV